MTTKKPDDESRPEPPALTTLLQAKLKSGRLTAAGICEAVGIKDIYLRSLLNGHRQWSSMPIYKLRALADLLDMKPRIDFLALAGVVDPDDWLPAPLQDVLETQYESMRLDAKVSALLPSREAWQRLDVGTRRLIVMMFLEILRLRAGAAVEEPPPPPPPRKPLFPPDEPPSDPGFKLEI